ncbi:MAG: hypothetical protein RIG68_20075 [Imperialibacter sp.]|uniref:hypothetical protein n=1 Tax=Imperialibacter sp. TaxID=2038411 RepID=UPI0032ED3D72
MKKFTIGLCLFLGLAVQHVARTQAEVPGKTTFKNYRNECNVKSVLGKRLLVMEPMCEGDCTPTDLRSVSEEKYFQSNTALVINSGEAAYEKLSYERQLPHRVRTSDEHTRSIGRNSNRKYTCRGHSIVAAQLAR